MRSEIPNQITRLKRALTNQLPGEMAHRLMLPEGRELYPENSAINMVQSSVLMLLFPVDGIINTCLIRRPSAMRNHGGQLAFPGGRFEPSDLTLEHTALRESFEEVGTDMKQIEIIGALTPLFVQVSNFTIHPFIGWCDNIPQFRTDVSEVDGLFIIPIERFLEHHTPVLKKVSTVRGALEVPGFFVNQLFIWGATAMIISEFKQVCQSEFLECPQPK